MCSSRCLIWWIAITSTAAWRTPSSIDARRCPRSIAGLPNEEVWRLIDVYVGAFADTHTGGSTYRPLLDGPPFDEAVTLTLE